MKKPKFEKVRVGNMAQEMAIVERRKALNLRIEKFLQTLTRLQRRDVKKHLAAGMELEDALKKIGWQINKTPKNG